MNDNQNPPRKLIKLAIQETFAPAIDFRAPYAKEMLEKASDRILQLLPKND